jgi:hypothetical protein
MACNISITINGYIYHIQLNSMALDFDILGPPPPPPVTNYLLLESGDYLLLETNYNIILE